MQEQEVINAIKYMQEYQTETDKLEVKNAEIDFPKKCYDTISAFANKYGGIIIFGINEHNSFIEQDVYDANDLQKQIMALCTDSMEPKIRPEFLSFTYNNKKLLAVKINEIPQNQKPCFYKNAGMHKGSYIRIGDSDQPMTEYEIYSLKSYADGIQEDFLDEVKIKDYLERTKKAKPNFSKFTDEKILKLSGIIEKSGDNIYPTLSGLMMFGEYPQGYLPQLFVACVVVPGTKLGDVGEDGQRFDDNKRVEGTLDEMLEQTLTFIRRNIGTKVVIDNNGKRENIPEYPMKALREAVANALIHRDYSISRESAYVYVQIYDDRIEIINPGDLYGNNRLENLGTDRMLESRNKNIVRLLEEKGDIIENRHTGIATMREEMKKMGLPEPEFESLRGDFKVIFRKEKKTTLETTSKIIQEITQEATQETTPKTTPKTAPKTTPKTTPKTEKDLEVVLSVKQLRMLNLIIEKPNITLTEIAQLMNLSKEGVKYNMNILKNKGVIERVGSNRNGYWNVRIVDFIEE